VKLIVRIDLDLGHGFEFGFIERRHLRQRGTQFIQMLLRLDQPLQTYRPTNPTFNFQHCVEFAISDGLLVFLKLCPKRFGQIFRNLGFTDLFHGKVRGSGTAFQQG
jgi:hypothetical protein